MNKGIPSGTDDNKKEGPTTPIDPDTCKNPAYIGTKIVVARLMTKEQFQAKEARKPGAPMPEVNGATPGYMVVYEDGYASWSPKDVFERSYRLITPAEKALV